MSAHTPRERAEEALREAESLTEFFDDHQRAFYLLGVALIWAVLHIAYAIFNYDARE